MSHPDHPAPDARPTPDVRPKLPEGWTPPFAPAIVALLDGEDEGQWEIAVSDGDMIDLHDEQWAWCIAFALNETYEVARPTPPELPEPTNLTTCKRRENFAHEYTLCGPWCDVLAVGQQNKTLLAELARLKEALTWAVGFIQCNLPRTSAKYPDMRNAEDLVSRDPVHTGEFQRTAARAEIAEDELARLRAEVGRLREELDEAVCVCGYPMRDHKGHGGSRVCERLCERRLP